MIQRVNHFTICAFIIVLCVLLVLFGKPSDVSFTAKPTAKPINFEPILEETRAKIRSDLSSYNFSRSGVDNLEDLIMESGGQPIQSIVLSTWRSGSTFSGELLDSIPGTLYHYEPFFHYTDKWIREPPESIRAVNTLKSMLKCNFESMREYFEYRKANWYLLRRNTRLWEACKKDLNICLNPDFNSQFCKLFPFQSMKIVRLRLNLVQAIFDDRDLNVKVIFLVRDPRGVMHSRQGRYWCRPIEECWWPDRLCADMIRNYVTINNLMQKYPDKLMVIRFEELALNPNFSAQRILNFLNIDSSEPVEQFLKKHTNAEVPGDSSTFKVSSDVPYKWQSDSDFKFVDDLQLVCKEAMDLWGYNIAYNETHMRHFNPTRPFTITQTKHNF